MCGVSIVGLVASGVSGYAAYQDWMQNWRAAEILQRQSPGERVYRNRKQQYGPHKSQQGPLPIDY